MLKISLDTIYILAEMGDVRARYLIRHAVYYVCKPMCDDAYVFALDLDA